MVNERHHETLTVNWIAERRKQTKNDSYFRQLVYSCIEGLRSREMVYAFTEEQIKAVVSRVRFAVVVIKTEDYYSMERASA